MESSGVDQPSPPLRVVSLLPSATELIFAVLEAAEKESGSPVNVELVGSAYVCS